jgi:hypothetical protein
MKEKKNIREKIASIGFLWRFRAVLYVGSGEQKIIIIIIIIFVLTGTGDF